MDALDVRILKRLVNDPAAAPVSWNVRRSFRSIAKDVGEDEGTVRNRIRKLYGSGFVADWRLLLNPRLTGGGDALVWLDIPRTLPKSELLAQLRFVEGVYVVGMCYSGFLYVALRYGREASRVRQVELIRRLAKAERVGVGRVPYPECTIRLSPSDWAVIGAVQKDPRRSYKSVSEELGLSSRTIKRKMEWMMQGNAVFGFPAFDPKKLEGAIWALLIVACSPGRREEVDRRVQAAFREYVWHALHLVPFTAGEPVFCGYNLMLANVAKGREILNDVGRMSAIQEARLELHEEAYTNFESLEEDVERYVRGSRVEPRSSD